MSTAFPPIITDHGEVTVRGVRRGGALVLELRGEHRLLRSMLADWCPRTAANRAIVRPRQAIHDEAALAGFYKQASLGWWIYHLTTPWPAGQ